MIFAPWRPKEAEKRKKQMAANPTKPAETGAGGTTQPAGAADDVLLPGQPGRGGAGES